MKAAVPSLEAVPEALRSEYEKQSDGTYALKIEGTPVGFAPAKDLAEANGKIVELRDTNIKLLKGIGAETIDAALTRVAAISGIDTAKLERLKVIDPDKYAALEAKAAKLKDKGVDDPDELDVKLKAMLDTALKPLNDKLTASENALAEERKRNADAALRQAVSDKFVKAGGKAKALDFIVAEAGKVFRVEGGQIKAASEKFSAEKPGDPLGLDEWLTGQARDNDFAFEPSKGAGAPPGGGNGNGAPRSGGGRQLINPTPEQLGELKFVPGKGLLDRSGERVEIVKGG